MLSKIESLDDVLEFTKILVRDEELNFHPDDDFHDYINRNTGESTYTPEAAEFRNKLLKEAFEICEKAGVDIYTYTMKPYLKASGLDQFISVPE